MAQDRPTAAELVAAVREFLDRDVLEATEGRVQFHTRVAINALGMVERELECADELNGAERARAVGILGHDGELRALEGEVAAGIRAGRFDDRLPEIREHVRATVRAKLLIANPGYVPGVSTE